jgi:hypothetical protein
MAGAMAFWSRKKPPAPPPPPSPSSHAPARVDPHAEVRWVPAASNPFGVEILDCRPFIRSAVAGIDDKHADSFARLRSSKGAEHRNAPPEQAAICPCDLRYGHSGAVEDGPLFKAESMEDKWDIYLYDNYLYFARSSTGTLEYRARIHFDGREAHVIAVEARRELVHGDPGYAVAAVDFLIRSHLYGQPIPHPLPRSVGSDDPRQLAKLSYSLYGRKGLYGTFADTTPLRAPAKGGA